MDDTFLTNLGLDMRKFISKAKNIIAERDSLDEQEKRLKKLRLEHRKVERQFISEMQDAGANSLVMDDGGTVGVASEIHCTINKNPDDVDRVKQWLVEHKADHLIKAEVLEVYPRYEEQLRAAGVPFSTITKFDTNSVKKWLKSQLGYTGGAALMSLSDLPHGITFYEDLKLYVR